MKQLIFLFLLVSTLNATGQSLTRKVLFLGNSYTYVNDLPQIVSELVQSTGDVLIHDGNLIGGYTLEDHAASSVSQTKILSDDWDYIVIQEQSQRPAFINPIAFMNGFSELKSFIEENKPCAQITAFMTWGYENGDAQNCPTNPSVCTYLGMQNLVTDRYMNMSDMYESEVTPVGEVWKYIRENHPGINLYQSDGSHPSLEGSYLAACCFYTSLYRKDPTLITNDYGLDASTAAIIRNATKQMVYDSLLDWYIGRYVPVSDFYYTIGSGLNEVQLNSTASVYQGSFSWDFGDGATSTSVNPTHSYAGDGTYTIQLASYRCFLGQNLESIMEQTVTFCAHTNTIYPDLLLCPDATDTIWTQTADSYQWCDFYGVPIPGATNQYMVAGPGEYSVLTTVNGCTERSPQAIVDSYLDNPDCDLGVGEPDPLIGLLLFPNPVQNWLSIQSDSPVEALVIFNLSGTRIQYADFQTSELDVSNLNPGCYLLQVKTMDGRIRSARFIKN